MKPRKQFLGLTGLALLGGAGLVYAATAGSKAASQRSLTRLADQAQQALLATEFKAARDIYSDILTVEPRDGAAADGEIYAYLKLGDYEHARAEEEKVLLFTPRPSKVTAINGAVIYLHAKIPMRGVKVLIQYLTSLPKVDEAALNALAICLNSADEHARKTSIYSSATTFYVAQNKKLEKTRPGMKRWGTEWREEGEAESKNEAWNTALTTNAKLASELAELKSHRAVIEAKQNDPVFQQQQQIQDYQRSQSFPVMKIPPLMELNPTRLDPEIAAEQAKYDQAMQNTERPPIPDAVEPMSVIPEKEPVVAVAVAIGMNGSDNANGSGTATPPKKKKKKPAPTIPSTTEPPAPTDTTSPPIESAITSPPLPEQPEEKKTYRVTSYAAAFPVGPDLLVTTAESVADAKEIEVQVADGTAYPASVVRSDADSGLALVRVSNVKLSYMGLADHFGGGTVSCVSFPSVDLFSPSATTINGSAMAPKDGWHVHLAETPRLGGGPLLANGKVVGVELATRDSDITAIPAVTLDDLKKFLASDFSPGGTADATTSTVQLSATREK
jgi:tetratricopeptide (TPR) repeat protein